MDESLPPAQSRTDQVVVAGGVALLAAGVVLSGVYTRKDGDIDWTNYLVGIAATLALLGIAGVSLVRLRTRVAEELVSWPGAIGILGVGVMLGIALDDADFTAYVLGIVVLALSAGGYLVCPSWTFVLTAIAGFALLYAKVVEDIFDAADLDGDNVGMVFSLALLIFTALVTVATWFLPERVVGAVVVGTVAVIGNFIILAGLSVAALVRSMFGGIAVQDDPFDTGSVTPRFDTYDNDVWVILVGALILAGGWAWLAQQTGHVGFRVLIVSISVAVVPIATVALAVKHPTWWGAVVGVIGAAALGWLVYRAMRTSSQAAA